MRNNRVSVRSFTAPYVKKDFAEATFLGHEADERANSRILNKFVITSAKETDHEQAT